MGCAKSSAVVDMFQVGPDEHGRSFGSRVPRSDKVRGRGRPLEKDSTVARKLAGKPGRGSDKLGDRAKPFESDSTFAYNCETDSVITRKIGGKRGAGSDKFGDRAKPFESDSMVAYDFVGKLGQGTHATVHRARSSRLGGRVVAVKVMSMVDEDAEEREGEQFSRHLLKDIQEEVAILARVSGRTNVIDFFGSFRERSLSFIVMEKCDCSLLQAIDRLPAITETTICRILKEMLTGLASVHELGVVHRDVKPDNFLCVGRTDTVKLCDFGLASTLPRHDAGLTGVCGTPPFMSPEMLLGRPYDQKTDVWSFGVIVYSLFHGTFPYEPPQRTSKAMMASIRSGIPAPSFRPPAAIVSAEKVSGAANQLAMDLLKREPETRISSNSAIRHRFFAKPGGTNLAPMLESARVAGSFTTLARNDPSQKNAVDALIESLQRQLENSKDSRSQRDADVTVHGYAKEGDDEKRNFAD